MSVKNISLKLVAYSDAAGKYDPNAPLNGNEDNFMVDADLSDSVAYLTGVDEAIAMSDLGCMMAVADGMGGQNAGEVAAEIAIETVAEYFKAERLTAAVVASPKTRAKYITEVIVEADRRVKAATVDHPEREGMGSTIVITWIKDDDITVGWLGDSRAYRYNPVRGLEPISVDHTYVQELVNKGILTYDETFGHPQGNIVTRSLGDPLATPPSPEHVNLKLYNGDIILMCSDGLSGVVPDTPSHGISDSIETIIAENYDDLSTMRVRLMEAAERNHWYDNVTILLCRADGDLPKMPTKEARKTHNPFRLILGLILVAAVAAVVFFLINRSDAPAALEDEDADAFTLQDTTVLQANPDTTSTPDLQLESIINAQGDGKNSKTQRTNEGVRERVKADTMKITVVNQEDPIGPEDDTTPTPAPAPTTAPEQPTDTPDTTTRQN